MNTKTDTKRRFAYGASHVAEHECPVTAAGFDTDEGAALVASQHVDTALAELGLIQASYSSPAKGVGTEGLCHPDDARTALLHALDRFENHRDSSVAKVLRETAEYHGWD